MFSEMKILSGSLIDQFELSGEESCGDVVSDDENELVKVDIQLDYLEMILGTS